MEPSRLRLRDLTFSDTDLPEVTLRFEAGLNLIIGASETGKSFVFEAIDYMLGASRKLRRIPEAERYDNISLSVDPTKGAPFTLTRNFAGGHFEVNEFPQGRDQPSAEPKTLKAAHSPDPDEALSPYLLRAIGMLGHQVRKNAAGAKKALSFRDVAHLAVIDEERIIQKLSPVLSGQFTLKTSEKSVFSFFLTGQSDTAIVEQEGREDRSARLEVEATTIGRILEQRQRELEDITGGDPYIAERIKKLDKAIENAGLAIVLAQEQVKEFATKRSDVFREISRIRSRVAFIEEQIKRLHLLQNFYQSDRKRLEGVLEASKVLHDLPEGNCPLCSQPYPEATKLAISHQSFEAACQRELEKIAVLEQDLQLTAKDFSDERDSRVTEEEALLIEMKGANEKLEKALTPALGNAKEELRGLIEKRTMLAKGESLLATINSLEEAMDEVVQARAERVAPATFESRATTAVASDFCKIVKNILRAWNYPDLEEVTFDTEKADIVINGQDRIDKGKGYRALTYAAFVIGLMQYCRKNDIPHPGFVVLDTPINPFKGPDKETPGESVADEVKVAFYEYLAADDSGDQIIIMENEEPPAWIREATTYYHFTKNVNSGRYGLFPYRPPTPAEGEHAEPSDQ